MNDTLKAIVGLLENGRPELQVASAQVLGELGAKDATIVRALGQAVVRSPVLGRYALESLAGIGSAQAWETVVRIMLEHENLADQAAHLLGEAGAKTHAVLAQAYATAATDQRQRILTILASSLGKASVRVFVQALLAPELVEHAASLLIENKERFASDAALQKLLREGLSKPLEDPLPDPCVVRILDVLAELDRASSRAIFLRFTQPKHSVAVRSAAFRALRGRKLPIANVRAMIKVLEDPAEKDVHGSVRDVLAELPEVPQGLLPVCKRLLTSRNPEQRLFALRVLRHTGGAEMAKVALKLLDHDDERFRDAAYEALSNNKQAIEPLVRLLTAAKDEAKVTRVGAILMRLGPMMTQKTQRAYAEKSVKLFSTNPRAGELLFDVVVSAGGAKVVPVLVEKAVRLRRAHRYAEALHILAKLIASEHGTDEASYQLALTRLLVDMNNPDSEVKRPGNATMGFFTNLVRSGFPLLERLRRENSVTPEAQLHIASHFANGVGEERRFGTELLKHLATRNKGRAGEEARYALRAAGA